MVAEPGRSVSPAATTDDCCATSLPPAGPVTGAAGRGLSTFRVEELDCATEEKELREALGGLAGVRTLSFDLVARRVTVAHDLDSTEPIAQAIRDVGCAHRS